MPKEVLIVGAGIGGLTAALKLHELGFAVTVIESKPEIQPLGVGINLLPHGVAVLDQLGLGERLAQTGVETRAIEYRTQFGQLIQSDPRGLDAGLPWPQLSIHRGHLQMRLLQAVRERMPEHTVVTGLTFESYIQERGGVTVFIRRPEGEGGMLTADAIIGADGIHSRVCEVMHPEVGPLHFSGTMMWRGAVEREPFLDGRTMVIAGYHGRKSVIYPISKDAMARGKSLVNWVAEIDVGPDGMGEKESWNREAKVEDFIGHFADWKFDYMDFPELFRSTEKVFVYPMMDRDPLPHWTDGQVTLLGDAAHPMYPIGANGASQAILDADALGLALAEAGDDLAAGFKLYEQRRLEPTSQVVLGNRERGPEKVLQLAHERVRGPGDKIEDVIAADELETIAREYRELAGFDAETLRRRWEGYRE